jgi:hypothetical protein
MHKSDCKKQKIHVEEAEVMLNYKKRIVTVAYRTNIEGLIEFNSEPSTIFQVRPVAQILVVAAVDGDFLCS